MKTPLFTLSLLLCALPVFGQGTVNITAGTVVGLAQGSGGIYDAGSLTNLQGSGFAIAAGGAASQVTNFNLTFGGAPYYTFTASTNLYFTNTSGGPGPVSWWITNSGAAGLIISVYFPTNALAGYTNDCAIAGSNYVINLTNTSSGRVLFLSAFKYGSSATFNDVVWNHLVSLP